MAELGTIELQLTGNDPRCPVCEDNIPVMCQVKLKSGSAQKAGSTGFCEPVLTVHVDYEVVSVSISHTCEVKKNG